MRFPYYLIPAFEYFAKRCLRLKLCVYLTHLLGFALGIELEILFVLLSLAQKDCKGKPARTPKLTELSNQDFLPIEAIGNLKPYNHYPGMETLEPLKNFLQQKNPFEIQFRMGF